MNKYSLVLKRNGEANLLSRDGTKWIRKFIVQRWDEMVEKDRKKRETRMGERTERQGRQYLGKNRETRTGGSARKQYLRAQAKTKAKAEAS